MATQILKHIYSFYTCDPTICTIQTVGLQVENRWAPGRGSTPAPDPGICYGGGGTRGAAITKLFERMGGGGGTVRLRRGGGGGGGGGVQSAYDGGEAVRLRRGGGGGEGGCNKCHSHARILYY